jgi:polysaccharide export outer membrane protein
MQIRISLVAAGLLLLVGVSPASSQSAPVAQAAEGRTETALAPTGTVAAAIPPGYVIGPDDVLQIVFWREKDMSGEVIVRPDGRISLPLLNDVVAAGRTPEQLRAALVASASEFFGNPNATVVVKEIRSRKVFITGSVEKPGPYVVTGPTTVLQLIAMAGGLKDYADKKNIVVMRTTNGQQVSLLVDYSSLLRRQKLEHNFELIPGDTILVR